MAENSSKLENRLDQFQSHSVHYVLLAARSTEAIRFFTDASRAGSRDALLAINRCQRLGDEVLAPKIGKNSSSAILVLDTRRFSQFTVDNFSMKTHPSGFAVPGSTSPSSTALDLSFDIIDSAGISFANFMQYIMQEKMQVNWDGLTMLMQVLFIGHKKDGSSETIQSVMIPAIFNEIGVDLNDTRGVYSCKLFPLIGAPSNQRVNMKWTHIGTASTFFTGPSKNTLEDIVESFEKRLNIESYKYYKEITGSGKGFGRPVQYMITIPDSWKGFKFNGPSSNAAAEVDFKTLLQKEEASRAEKAKQSKEEKDKEQRSKEGKTSAKNESQPTPKDSHVSVDSGMTIPDVLDFIFRQCPDVAKLANFGKSDTSKNIKFYKNLISVTSDDESVTVHIDVVEFVVPRVMIEESNAKDKAQGTKVQNDDGLYQTGSDGGKRPKNYLEFDYIFSGKNLDVLSLDLKIQNLVWLLASKANLGTSETNRQANSDQEVPDDGEGAQKDTVVSNVRAKDPILIPLRTEYEKTNFSNLSGATGDPEEDGSPQVMAQQYVRNLSKFYNGGGAVAKMELRGNPDLMVFVSMSDIQVHSSAVSTDSEGNVTDPNRTVKATYRKNFEETLVRTTGANQQGSTFVLAPVLTGPRPVGSPVYVKVNVYGPNVDFRTNELIRGEKFSTELLYDNFYWLASIENKIVGSKFTQELELQTFSVYGAKSAVSTGNQTESAPSVK